MKSKNKKVGKWKKKKNGKKDVREKMRMNEIPPEIIKLEKAETEIKE